MPAVAALPAPDAIPLTTAIPRPARLCYELFCEADRMPEWITVVQSAQVVARNRRGRPIYVSFLGRLERATIGYSLQYHYRERDLGVSWATPPGSTVVCAGWAQFTPLSDKTTLLTYDLTLEVGGELPAWDDPFFDGHAASAVMSDFRDFVVRTIRIA